MIPQASIDPERAREVFERFWRLDPQIERAYRTGEITPAVASSLTLYAEKCADRGRGTGERSMIVRENGQEALAAAKVAQDALDEADPQGAALRARGWAWSGLVIKSWVSPEGMVYTRENAIKLAGL